MFLYVSILSPAHNYIYYKYLRNNNLFDSFHQNFYDVFFDTRLCKSVYTPLWFQHRSLFLTGHSTHRRSLQTNKESIEVGVNDKAA